MADVNLHLPYIPYSQREHSKQPMNMNKSLITTILALAISLPATHAADKQTGSGENDGYKLVWQELFDGKELNPQRWEIEVNGDGNGNNELQYYTDREANVRLGDDGEGNRCLILTAIREKYNGKNFTSGRIISKNRIAFKYGKIEASIKLPTTANGLWPAFWMMGNDYDEIGWPRCGEIDIMEFGNAEGIKNGTQDRYFNGACHWGPSWQDHPNYAHSITNPYSLQDGKFHLFTLIWDEEKIAMYVDLDKHPDALPYYEMTIPASDNDYAPGKYFHKENFILFNLAVGGYFTGILNDSGITALNEENGNKASMYVNYVRIYQKGGADDSHTFLDKPDEDPTDIHTAQSKPSIIQQKNGISISEKSDIRIYNLTGTLEASSYGKYLSTNQLPRGIYLIKVMTSGGKHLTKKITKV